MKSAPTAINVQFLNGGGELGDLIRKKDWSKTILGDPECWPQSLRTTLNILLNTKFPMFLWWGPELIQFYNDAYRPSLGENGKHPTAIGQRAEDCWQEIWHIIKPLIDQVKNTGEATWSENQLVPIFRNGSIEDVYWTFGYSPVRNEDGDIEGVLVVCHETTKQMALLKKLEQSEAQFRNLIKEAPIATALFTGPEFVIEIANEEALHLWGKNRDVIGKKVIDAIPELKGQPYMEILENVFRTGETYFGNENLALLEIDGKIQSVYINFIYKALKNSEGKIWAILTMGHNVSEQIEARKKLEDSEERLRLAIDGGMLGTFDIDLINNKIIYSKRFSEIFGFNRIDVTYDEIIQSIHPDDLPIRNAAREKAIAEGNLNYEARFLSPDKAVRWINVRGKFFYDEHNNAVRILGTAMDVTAQKKSLDSYKINEQKFRNTVKQAPVGITIFRGPEFLVEMANSAYLEIVDRKEEDFVGKPLFESLPEVKESISSILTNVLRTGTPYYGAEFPVMLNRYGKKEITYFDFVYQPYAEETGEISGIIVIATEVTESVKTKQLLAESEKQFRNLVMQSPIPMAIIRGENYIIEMANAVMFEKIWRRNERDLLGKGILEVFPELKSQKYPKLLKEVFTKGKSHKENESLAYVSGSDGIKAFYLDYEYSPLFDTDEKVSGIMITVNDVTEKVEARRKTEHAEERLRLAMDAAQLGAFDWDLETQQFFSSDRLKEIFGFATDKEIAHHDLINGIHPDDTNIRDRAVEQSLKTGNLDYEVRVIWPDKSVRWIRVYGKISRDTNDTPIRMYGTVLDTTEQRIFLENLKENETRFRLLADSMPQFVWTADPQGNLNYFNLAVYNYSGLTPLEIERGGWLQIVHTDEREENIRQWKNSITTGEPFIFEHRFRRHDGEYRWQLSRAIPQKNSLGNIEMWVGTSTDIQEQRMFLQELEKKIMERTQELKQINEQLKKSEARYHLMVGEVQDYAIIYLNREGIIENWNKGAEKIKGYKAEEIIGKNFSIFYTELDKKNNLPQRLLEEASKNGRATHEGWRSRKDGSLFWGNIVITALRDETNDIIGFSKVTRDLTDKKEADDRLIINAAQLEQKNIELEKMNVELESFAYVSSHDLQEPLRKIQTFSSLILEKEKQNLSDSGKDYFKRMQMAAKRMQLLIDDLLAYSRTSTVVKSFLLTDFNDIISEVKKELKETLEQKHAVIESKGQCEINLIPFQFRQLLLNLIGNSLKFAREGIPPRIKLQCEIIKGSATGIESLISDAKYCHISFSDNGIGFDSKYGERIFEVFQRLHGKEQYEGTGIGLAIVKKIVENHNGIIKATGKLGEGARFDIYLPE